MNARHGQWPEIIEAVKPATIVEIGTHRGVTAELLVREALKYSHHVEYTGFDLFEAMANRSALDIALGKFAAPKIKFAEGRLAAFGRWLTFSLISGSTTETLHKRPMRADLVFIDGAYSRAMISADYAALQESGCIIVNNFFEPIPPETRLPEVFELLGCNHLTSGAGGRVLPAYDDVQELGIRAKFVGIKLPEGVI